MTSSAQVYPGTCDTVVVPGYVVERHDIVATSDDGGTTWHALAHDIDATDIKAGDLIDRGDETFEEVESVIRFKVGTVHADELLIVFTDDECEFIKKSDTRLKLLVSASK
jgi:hypothetical protein